MAGRRRARTAATAPSSTASRIPQLFFFNSVLLLVVRSPGPLGSPRTRPASVAVKSFRNEGWCSRVHGLFCSKSKRELLGLTGAAHNIKRGWSGRLRGGFQQEFVDLGLNQKNPARPMCPHGIRCPDQNDTLHSDQWRHPCLNFSRFHKCALMNNPAHVQSHSHIDTRDELDRGVLEFQDTVSDAFRKTLALSADVDEESRKKCIHLHQEALVQFDENNQKQALELITEAIRCAPLAPALAFRAEIFLSINKPNHALIDSARATKVNQKYPKPHKIAARAFCKLGKWRGALQKIILANKLAPDQDSIDLQRDLVRKIKEIEDT